MDDLKALRTARQLVEQYGAGAEAEVNRRAEDALVKGDIDAFNLWTDVIFYVSDMSQSGPWKKSTSGEPPKS